MRKQQSYYFTTRDVKALLATPSEGGDWCEFVVTDEFEVLDEEEYSELEEMEEDRTFYSSQMCLYSASNLAA